MKAAGATGVVVVVAAGDCLQAPHASVRRMNAAVDSDARGSIGRRTLSGAGMGLAFSHLRAGEARRTGRLGPLPKGGAGGGREQSPSARPPWPRQACGGTRSNSRLR